MTETATTSEATSPVKKDLVIVGGGPAGLSAAIYASRSLLDAVTFEREALGGQLILTSEVDNYPGAPNTDGFSLTDAMRAQAEGLGASIVMDPVREIAHDKATGRFLVRAASATYDAASVILAAGAHPRHAGFEGEERYAGHGVSYCATCDGMFYRNKQVYVIGGGNSAAEEALFLTRFASKVTLVVRKDHLRAQAAILKQLEDNEKVEIRLLTSIVSVDGAELMSSVTFRDNASGTTHVETLEEGSFGIFVLVGRVPETELVRELVELDKGGYAVTDERMATKIPGLFVAGDCRQKPLRQIVTAAADGAVAATSAAAFLGRPVEG